MKGAVVAAAILVVAAAHFLIPSGVHEWHWLHILFQKLSYLPVIMAAAWFGLRGTFLTAGAVSALFLVHILLDWGEHPMTQTDQFGEIASLWIVALTASLLFRKERTALEEAAEAHRETIVVLASALDLRERETGLHSERVRAYALLLADRLGIEEGSARDSLGMGALLHDIGKIGVPDGVLLKKGELTGEEREMVRIHPDLGASLLQRIPFLAGAREIVRAHHEKFDGSGYPEGMAGEGIPLGARIFAVVDVFDAMTSDRPYKSAMPYGMTVEAIRMGRGSQFDPLVVDAFLGIPFPELQELAKCHGVDLKES